MYMYIRIYKELYIPSYINLKSQSTSHFSAYICTYIYVHIHIYVYIYTYICICIYIYTKSSISQVTSMLRHIEHPISRLTYIHTYIRIYTYICLYIYIYMYVYIHIYKQLYILSYMYLKSHPTSHFSAYIYTYI